MTDPLSLAPQPQWYWHLWTDENGISRQEKCAINSFELFSLNTGFPTAGLQMPQFSHKLFDNGNALLSILPVGWKGDWHENAIPKLIYVLRGAWWVESMDGHRVVVSAGEFCFGGDQGCIRPADGKFGHLSAQIGDEPSLHLIIQRNDDAWRGAKPGYFS